MDLRFDGKTIIVTGGTSGIGAATCVELGASGATVIVAGRGMAKAENMVAQIVGGGGKAHAVQVDVADAVSVQAMVRFAVETTGSLYGLVNNAGITRDGLMMRMSEEQWDNVITVNLKSAFNFVHAVTPVMMRQKSGSIVNMSSVVGVSGNAGQANYAASKAGMIGLSKSLAKELGSRNIRVNAVAPGFIETDMTGALSEDVKTEWAQQIPLRRSGTPEDVANVALFLASDLSGYVTGQVLSVCGGMGM